MKKISLILSLLFVMSVNWAGAQSASVKTAPVGADAAISMVKEKYDIGKVTQETLLLFIWSLLTRLKSL
ncbi:hypothetical protein [Niabella hibiscisoli]|uniref:hypothetical protein n=1 Tax=Niabella hibiscisoli TaxID=1825928 RepID=UPI001F0DCE1D|nr:hypothetical protein [Niabella hibiscisoli]MCH5721167.1 hypothetical protein [Niabella hibiscisoli]